MSTLPVLIDLDSIVADFWTPLLREYNAAYNDSRTIADMKSYMLEDNVKPECGAKIDEIISSPGFFQNMPVLPGALNGISRIRSQFDVVFVTAPFGGNTASGTEKIEWCKEHLGVSHKDVMLTHKKDLVMGHALIDDGPHNIEAYRTRHPNTPILTIAYPYNYSVNHLCYRYDGWKNTRAAWSLIADFICQGS
jgi:5'-nucleotidase